MWENLFVFFLILFQNLESIYQFLVNGYVSEDGRCELSVKMYLQWFSSISIQIQCFKTENDGSLK